MSGAEEGAVDAQRIVHEEFVRWFDRRLAGPLERCRVVAESIWTYGLPTRVGTPDEGFRRSGVPSQLTIYSTWCYRVLR